MVSRRGLLGAGLGALALGPGLVRAQARRVLLTRYGALASLPWLDLGGRPTPLTRHPELARRIGLGELLVKRDDRAGHPYGGSKARKLELLLGEAIRRGHRSVLTFGGVGSNHALATAVHARRLGLGCHLVLLHEPPSDHSRAHLLAAAAVGATLHAGRRGDRDDPRVGARLAPGEDPFVIPMGGTAPLGDAGYVDAAFELAAQLPEPPDAIYVAVGTTGTLAGIAIGLRALGWPTRLIGVRASGRATGGRRRVAEEVERTVAMLRRRDPSFPEVRPSRRLFELDHRAVGEGYARPTRAGARATRLSEAHGGPPLDPTYTAKVMSALVRRAGEHRGDRVLFWQTYDPRLPAPGDATVEDLPLALRGYARE